MTIEEEYKALKSKRGRKSAEQKARLEELEALLKEKEMSDETEATEPEKAGMARVEIACDNLCVPWGEHTKLCYQGEQVEVPASFAEQMGERVKVL